MSSSPPSPDPASLTEKISQGNGPQAPASPEVKHISFWRFVALSPIFILMRLWNASLRFRVTAAERSLLADTPNVITVTWHNRDFLGGELYRRFRSKYRLVALVSASRDGAWLAAYFKMLGMLVVRGSSSKRGVQAMREIIAESRRSGADIAITPDGPRGPLYDIKPGILLVARLTKLPLLLIAPQFHSAWRTKSWDGFYLPKPFSVVEIHVSLMPEFAALADSDPAAATCELKRRMLELTFDSAGWTPPIPKVETPA